MPYVPHTIEDRDEMLARVGVKSIDDLFHDVPKDLRIAPGSLDIEPCLDESRIVSTLSKLAATNKSAEDLKCFLGAGIYDRFIPSSVGAIISRGEFLTAYTPYQPEASQGFLQTIYEFQSMIAELYGMEVANASMYDGATSMAEAAIMAHSINGKSKVAVSEGVNPHYRQVLETYCWALGLEVVTIPCTNGLTQDYSSAGEDISSIIVGYPNFFGIIEDLNQAKKAAESSKSLLIVVADPVSCAVLPPPGEFGADVVVGEGQSLGVSMGFGGPLVGLFTCNEEHVRRLPGRIVGKTSEIHGDKSGFAMTLRTREQDIRREKATSNICTNEALMALANTVYLSALGKNGLTQVATSSVQNSRYAMKVLANAGGKVKFSSPMFCEFVLELPANATQVRHELIDHGILAGLPLGKYYSGMDNCLLVAVTEKKTKQDIDDFGVALAAVLGAN